MTYRFEPNENQLALHWKMGFEIELLAPSGKNRQDLAEHIAQKIGGQSRRFFFADSEPSKVPGKKVFYSFTPGFEVLNADGIAVARFIDDITIQRDLNRQAKPTTDWYRILSDDPRLLHLVQRHADPNLPISEVLVQSGKLFGSAPKSLIGGVYRLADSDDRSIAMASGLPGERERTCEIVSAPIEHDHQKQLELLLSSAQELGFFIPAEAAIHLHFDSTRLHYPTVLRNLGALLYPRRQLLRKMLKTNPNCRRLGPWPGDLLKLLRDADSAKLTWEQLRSRMTMKIVKYCDFNVRNLIFPSPNKSTFEVRILPVSLNAETIMRHAKLFEAVLERACGEKLVTWSDDAPVTAQEGQRLFDDIGLHASWTVDMLAHLPESQ